MLEILPKEKSYKFLKSLRFKKIVKQKMEFGR